LLSFSFGIPDDRAATYVEALEQVISGNDPQLIMCVVSNNRLDRYASIKKKCCLDRAGELDFNFDWCSYQ
jgi:aubergine-like protein